MKKITTILGILIATIFQVQASYLLIPMDDAFTPFIYEHSYRSAAVAYSGTHRSILMGFPFEAIRSDRDRDLVMTSFLQFLSGK